MEQNYSVLMSVYKKEQPEFLKQSIESMLAQSICPNDFVIVCDGPLTKELYDVLKVVESEHKGLFQIVRLPQNRGLGCALKEGLNYCKNDIVARMDSDDISIKKRCEMQLEALEREQADIVGGWVEEFQNEPSEHGVIRSVPEKNEEILSYAKKRNPFNHPTVMFRKEAVFQVGNYQTCRGFEDYHLWVRMLKAGYRGYNIKEVLVYMRGGNGMYKRRGGWHYFTDIVTFQNFMRKIGYIGTIEFIVGVVQRGIVSLMPHGLRQIIYRIFLRNTEGQSAKIDQKSRL